VELPSPEDRVAEAFARRVDAASPFAESTRAAVVFDAGNVAWSVTIEGPRMGLRLGRLPRADTTVQADIATLAAKLGAPVLLAARAGLGTINHTLLTIEAIERDGCTLAGVILSRRPDEDPALAAQNAAEIRRRWPGEIIELASDPAVLDSLCSTGKSSL